MKSGWEVAQRTKRMLLLELRLRGHIANNGIAREDKLLFGCDVFPRIESEGKRSKSMGKTEPDAKKHEGNFFGAAPVLRCPDAGAAQRGLKSRPTPN